MLRSPIARVPPRLCVCVWLILVATGHVWADPLRYRGVDSELTISQVGELDADARARRLQVELVPGDQTNTIDYDGTRFEARFSN